MKVTTKVKAGNVDGALSAASRGDWMGALSGGAWAL